MIKKINDIILPQLVAKLVSVVNQSGFEIYIVGGAVHDLLLGISIHDWDFTTNAKPEEIQQIFPESFYDNKFGTVGVTGEELAKQFGFDHYDWDREKISPNFVFDITTFRSEEKYTDRRRPDKVIWGKTLTDDLKRRDFTINAMAIKLKIKKQKAEAENENVYKVELIDPFEGKKDLQNKLIKAVGDPNTRFTEDALRMMRAIRVAAQLGFMIETNTLEAVRKNSSLLEFISGERIREELFKTLVSPWPAEGIKMFFSTGLLAHFLPELEKMRGVEQSGHHTKDVWNHSLDALSACPSPNPVVRLAVLLHDVGKPHVRRTVNNKEYTFYNHEMVSAKIALDVAWRLRLSKKQTEKLYILVRYHMFSYQPKMTDSAIRRFIKNVKRENLNDMIMLRIGDRIGGGSKATSWRLRELQKRIGENLYAPMQVSDMEISGNDVIKVLGIKSGPMVGKILNKLFEEVMEEGKKNNKDYLIKRAKEISKKLS